MQAQRNPARSRLPLFSWAALAAFCFAGSARYNMTHPSMHLSGDAGMGAVFAIMKVGAMAIILGIIWFVVALVRREQCVSMVRILLLSTAPAAGWFVYQFFAI